MKSSKFFSLMFCFFTLLLIGWKSSSNTELQTDMFQKDVQFIVKTILENHPGPKNKLDPEFMNILNKFEQEALAQADTVLTQEQHTQLLKKQVQIFCDKHLRFFPIDRLRKVKRRKRLQTDFFIKELSPCVTWVTIPIFWPQGKQLKQLKTVIEQLPQHRNDDVIIFDVRGNGGGNSAWGMKIIKTLFGESYAESKINEWYRGVYADWRVSKGNVEHAYMLIDLIKKKFGQKSQEFKNIMRLYNGMKTAFEKNYFFHAESEAISLSSEIGNAEKNMCFAKVLVLIDENCFSSCLAFLDQLKCLDSGVLFVGKATKADNNYMDVRRVELPSKLGCFQFPMKVARNRKHDNNEPYHPDIVYEGDFNNTKEVEQWLKEFVLNK